MTINWWKTSLGEKEINRVVKAIRNKNISQGPVTKEFETNLGEYFEIDHVVAVSSGSSALLAALMALGVKQGDEVIMPNRTWIATAHAAHMLGAKVVLVDVEEDRPIIDASAIEKKITSKTKVILPVHMNGRSANMPLINKIAKKFNIAVVEDACEAISSRNSEGFLGTQSDIGCFSLSIAKTIGTGQGGFTITRNKDLADKMRAIRTQGVENVKDPGTWTMPGFNFRFTDILASIGIEQLKRLPDRISKICDLYSIYLDKLKETEFKAITVDLNSGEIPVYNEFLVENRDKWVKNLEKLDIESRPFYPNINEATYLYGKNNEIFPNSMPYQKNGLTLPSGPDQDSSSVEICVNAIKKLSE